MKKILSKEFLQFVALT